MIDKLFGSNSLIEKSLDASWLRNETISHNIANVDTPGYKRKTVKFEEYLNSQLEGSLETRTTDKRHIKASTGNSEVTPRVTVDHSNMSMRLDGNNVDIENEMASMAKNTIKYNTLVQSLNARLRRLRSAIDEGGR